MSVLLCDSISAIELGVDCSLLRDMLSDSNVVLPIKAPKMLVAPTLDTCIMLHYSYKYHTIRLFFLQSVKARSEKIAEDEQRCKQLADVAQKDLDAAIPALEEAVKVSDFRISPDSTTIHSL